VRTSGVNHDVDEPEHRVRCRRKTRMSEHSLRMAVNSALCALDGDTTTFDGISNGIMFNGVDYNISRLVEEARI